MTLREILAYLEIDGTVMIAGLFGGVLRALSRRIHKLRELIASPICGALAAAYLTEPISHYLRNIGWPMPPDGDATTNATAFLIGIGAMWIADFMFELIARRLNSSVEK